MSLSFLLRSFAFIAVVGAALVSASWATGEWAFSGISNAANNMVIEQSRGEVLDDVMSTLHRRFERKTQAVEGLLSGWMTFDEAASEFREANRATKLPWDRDKDEETTAREVLSSISAIEDEDPRAVEALPQLQAEFQARFSR
jgi:hypothetical protein